MTLADFAKLAEIIGALGVIASLVFVGVQIHQHTRYVRRSEANKAFEQASQIREVVIANRDVAQLLLTGITDGPLDVADEIRLNAVFNEFAYVAIQVWDREKYGLSTIDSFDRAVPPC